MFRILIGAVVGLAMVGLTGLCHAVPLNLSYSVTDTGSLYYYEFTLTLDNKDGLWTPGMEWDWIIFGDIPSATSPLDDFVAIDVPTGATVVSSNGGHNGPTLQFGDSPLLPGWMPSAVGESIMWSGTSATFLDQGSLLWSTLQWPGFDNNIGANYEVGELTSFSVMPIPAALPLFAAALAGMGFLGWRRSRSAG